MPVWTKSPPGETFDPDFRYETSWIFPPVLLFVIRAILSLYAFATLFTIFGYNGTHGLSTSSEHSFSYFTNLTYWGLAFYFLFSSFHTCTYALTGTPALARWPRLLQAAHSIFYSTVVVFPFLVTISYWALLYSRFDSVFSTWTNTSQHALNAGYALFEIVFPRTGPLPFLHLIPIIIILGLYLALAYLTQATEGFYVYFFLDNKTNSSGKVAAYCVGILVGAIVIFLVVRYLLMFRVWLTEKKFMKSGKFSSRDRRSRGERDAEEGVTLDEITNK